MSEGNEKTEPNHDWDRRVRSKDHAWSYIAVGALLGDDCLVDGSHHRAADIIERFIHEFLSKLSETRSVEIPSVTEIARERVTAATSLADECKGVQQTFEDGFDAAIAFICRKNGHMDCFCGCHDSTTTQEQVTTANEPVKRFRFLRRAYEPCCAFADCVCATWGRDSLAAMLHLPHHPDCKMYKPETPVRELLLRLIDGIESWAADEDGVHADCWDAYTEACGVVGMWDRPGRQEPA